jgi:NitT/TauT family transport system permease protein
MPAKQRYGLIIKQIGLFVLIILAWEMLTRMNWIDPFFFSRPSLVMRRLYEWFVQKAIYVHIYITTVETLLAFFAGSFLGVIFGFLFARIPTLASLFDPYVKIANALPRIALAPIFTLWFGLGILSKVVFGVTLVFFIVFFNTYRGVREVDPNVLDNARMLGGREWDLFRHVLMPSAMSWILASLHTSVGMALVGAVVGEYLGSARGLGYIIAQAEGVFDTTGVFAGLIVLSVFVLIIDIIVSFVENRLLKWKPAADGRA